MILHKVPKDKLDTLRRGDVLHAIDDHQLPNPLVIEDVPEFVDPWSRPIRLRREGPLGWVLYADSVFEHVTIERPVAWNTEFGIRLEPIQQVGGFRSETGRYSIFPPEPRYDGWRVYDWTQEKFLEGWGTTVFDFLEEAVELIVQQDVEIRI